MAYTYPENDLDRSEQLMAVLGSMWSHVYQEDVVVPGFVRARAQLTAQSYLSLLETLATLSRFEVPIYHTDQWYHLELKESEMNVGEIALARYDGRYVYDSSGRLRYGTPLQDGTEFAFPLPAGLEEVPALLNRLSDTSLNLTPGLDYWVDKEYGAIRFRFNPFETPLIQVKETISDSGISDRVASLWVFRGGFDWETTYKHFGYVLGAKARSSEGFRELLNAIFDSLLFGATANNVNLALSAMTGVPLSKETSETVELITRSDTQLVIATDQHAYKFHKNAVANVAVGDVLPAGSSLITALKSYEFNRGQVSSDLRALTLDKGLLIAGFQAELTFENESKALTVETAADGFTKISFEIGGLASDVARFWEQVHSRGVANGQTLAHLLDTRTNKVGEPAASNLPTTINPLEFLAKHVLRHHGSAVLVNTSHLGPQALGLSHFKLLRKILPPHTLLILVIELTHAETALRLGSGETPRYTESVSDYSGLEPASESINSSKLLESVRIRQWDGWCGD